MNKASVTVNDCPPASDHVSDRITIPATHDPTTCGIFPESTCRSCQASFNNEQHDIPHGLSVRAELVRFLSALTPPTGGSDKLPIERIVS